MIASKIRVTVVQWLCVVGLSCLLAAAQTSTNVNLNLDVGGLDLALTNWMFIAQTGSVAPLGNASLTVMSTSNPDNGAATGPVQIVALLAFNQADSISISFTVSDPTFVQNTIIMMPGGTITGGTGAYAGASGSLDITIPNDPSGNNTTTGSGTLIIAGNTIPLTLSNFHGGCCASQSRQYNTYTRPLNVSGSLGNASGTMLAYWYLTGSNQDIIGTATINFNGTDSLTLLFIYPPVKTQSINSPSSFSGAIAGGTGRFANASGPITWNTTSNGFSVSGTMTTVPGAQITKVKTIFGWPQAAYNTWIEIHGTNLVPPDTPSTGVDWSNAPDFANGLMPTQLGPIKVLFTTAGTPGYIYYYCSAASNPNCADDQINVLAPLLPIFDPAPMVLTVENNGVPIATTSVFRAGYSPAFLTFDQIGHVVAQHLDYSLVGPSNLYPGQTTPAKGGETIILYATGFGPPSGTPIVAGSAMQSGNLSNDGLQCTVSGVYTSVAGALVSPGLYQLNLRIPKGLPSGDNPVVCVAAFYSTFPGSVITLQ